MYSAIREQVLYSVIWEHVQYSVIWEYVFCRLETCILSSGNTYSAIWKHVFCHQRTCILPSGNMYSAIWKYIFCHLGFLTKFRFAKISRNWLRNDFRVSRKCGTSFASFAVSRNCRVYERNDFRETRKSRKRRKLWVTIQNLTIFLFLWRCLLKSSLA